MKVIDLKLIYTIYGIKCHMVNSVSYSIMGPILGYTNGQQGWSLL